MKQNLFIVLSMLAMTACGHDITKTGTTIDKIDGGVTNVVQVKSSLSLDISTDKACYQPGQTVTFSVTGTMPQGVIARYSASGEKVSEQPLTSNTWTWSAPAKDFTGYMVELFQKQDDGSELVLGTIAVDVSSDWTSFPRYGFVATYDQSKTLPGVIESEMTFLNRCHINGIQFYDWHNKHHWPLGGTKGNLDVVYKDIANRDVYTSVIKKYIDVQHSYGMKAMFYNLCFGALKDASADGVKEEWYLFKDQNHTTKDVCQLPDGWKSSIWLVDPSNQEWQQYIGQRNDDVYDSFNFDGYHIDQLGSRGTVYTYGGGTADLQRGYASFIEAMKTRRPEKRLVMNAVSSFGASTIAGTGKTDFLYNELWDSEADFSSIEKVLHANSLYSNGKKQTVLAAYMNYGKSDGEFNTPGVLLTDAVIFALGGSHLELGDHMLCREYFANNSLKMSNALKTSIVHYYDFMTAYQNLLRGGGETLSIDLTSSGNSINAWPPRMNTITTIAKKVGNRKVIHLINFLDADNLSWRDMNGTMPEPRLKQSLSMKLKASEKVNKIWVASPDTHGGAMQELTFVQKDGFVTFTVPSLKYWTMIVLE